MTLPLMFAAALATAPAVATLPPSIAAASQAVDLVAEALEPLTQASGDAPFCTADGELCVTGTREGAFAVSREGRPVARWTAAKAEEDDHFVPLPSLLRLKDGALLVIVGVVRDRMYSGGTASVTMQRIMLVRPGQAPTVVLEAPFASLISLRACFSDKDARQRLDACFDEYSLETFLKAGPATSATPPNLLLSVMASSFPRGVSRDADSLAAAPLTKSDLIEVDDKTCSYIRRFHFYATAGVYQPDAPMPACEQYTVP
jgi:hypothetical protein